MADFPTAPVLSDAGRRTLEQGRAERAHVDELLGDLAELTDLQLEHLDKRVGWEREERDARRAWRQMSTAVSTGHDWTAAAKHPSHAEVERRRQGVAA